jgi:hypothetical protein
MVRMRRESCIERLGDAVSYRIGNARPRFQRKNWSLLSDSPAGFLIAQPTVQVIEDHDEILGYGPAIGLGCNRTVG